MVAEIIAECETLVGHRFTEFQREKITGYYQLLLTGNQTSNLISKKSERDVLKYGILEAYGLSVTIKQYTGRMIDIGSGSGLPGMLVSIFQPQNPIVLLDIITKRCEFMEMVKNELNLQNVTVINCKIEKLQKLGRTHFHSYDVVFSSGVGHYEILLKHYYRLINKSGLIVLLTGAKATNNLEFSNSRTIVNPYLDHRNLILIENGLAVGNSK